MNQYLMMGSEYYEKRLNGEKYHLFDTLIKIEKVTQRFAILIA